MADLSFINKLTPAQEEIANMVADKAISMGIDPRLAVSLAYQESGFKPDAVSPKGAVGIMQVMPATGKEMGFTAEDLADPSKNIDAGMMYLKRQIDKFQDPVVAVAAYNAGPNHPYFSDPDNKELPEETMNYLKSINSLGGFTSTPGFGGAQEEKEKEPVEVSDEDFDKTRAALLALGSITGGVTGFGGGLLKGTLFPGQPGQPGAAAGTSAGEKWARATGYGMGEGTVRDVRERFKAAQPQPTGAGKITSKIKAVPGTVAPLSIHAVPPPQPAPYAPSAASRMYQGAKQVAGASINPKVSWLAGGLSGLGATELGMQSAERFLKDDPVGGVIAGAGALGSLASLVPHPAPRVVGGGLAMASPAALYVLDKMRQARQTPPPQQMSDVMAP